MVSDINLVFSIDFLPGKTKFKWLESSCQWVENSYEMDDARKYKKIEDKLKKYIWNVIEMKNSRKDDWYRETKLCEKIDILEIKQQ